MNTTTAPQVDIRQKAAAAGTMLFDPHVIAAPLVTAANFVMSIDEDAKIEWNALTTAHPSVIAGVSFLKGLLMAVPAVAAIEAPAETLGNALLGMIDFLGHFNDGIAATPKAAPAPIAMTGPAGP